MVWHVSSSQWLDGVVVSRYPSYERNIENIEDPSLPFTHYVEYTAQPGLQIIIELNSKQYWRGSKSFGTWVVLKQSVSRSMDERADNRLKRVRGDL